MVSVCLPSDALSEHGFLLPWMWDISSRLLQQSTATAPYLGRGVSPPAALPDLQRGMAPLGPPVPVQLLLLGMLLKLRALALGMGGSSQLLSLAWGSGWLLRVTTPGLGCEMASPSCP